MYRLLKGYSVVVVLMMVSLFLVYSQHVSKKMDQELETISRIYGKFCSKAGEDEVGLIFDEIIAKINFPVIITDMKGNIISTRNVDSPTPKLIQKLDKIHPPIEIKYKGKPLALVHYGKTKIREILEILPFIQLFLAILLLVIGIFWFYTLKKSEENALFVGLSKETAHQLGTPISAIMGWKDLIKDEEIKENLEEDLNRLKKVSSRFYKIGNPIEKKSWNIEEIIKPTIEYIKERIPKNVKIKENYESKFKVEVDIELFSWMLENLIKNSVDAQSTEVIIKVKKVKKKKTLVIKDNGEGISKEIRRKLFSPGITTKQFGWGIGLSFVKRIVTLHRWKITYQPNRKEKGVSFIITMGR